MESRYNRRTLLKGGILVTAISTLGQFTGGNAHAATNTTADRIVVKEPKIFTTRDWNARAATGPILVERRKPTYIVVHHTVEPDNSEDYSKERALSISRFIQDLHMDRRGWIDSGQQFTNSRGGYITEGRHQSLSALRSGTTHVQGSNVGNHNSEVIGIENEGLYSTVDVPEKLWESLVKLVAYIAYKYQITPEFIKGHRDFNSTECPGQILYNRLPEFRTAVGVQLGLPATARAEQFEPAEWPLLKPGDTGHEVLIAQHLLRANGFAKVPTDGLFGPSTRDAVNTLALRNELSPHSCYATTQVDETGFVGSDIWPLIITTEAPGAGSDAAQAAAVLAHHAGIHATKLGSLTTQRWKELLTLG